MKEQKTHRDLANARRVVTFEEKREGKSYRNEALLGLLMFYFFQIKQNVNSRKHGKITSFKFKFCTLCLLYYFPSLLCV